MISNASRKEEWGIYVLFLVIASGNGEVSVSGVGKRKINVEGGPG